jgi:hypothetical protein
LPRLTDADELFVHQIPEPLPNVVTHHDHWRESYFFALHPREGSADVVVLAMAHFPKTEVMDALQLGRIGGEFIFARHERHYDGDPHTSVVGPVSIEIVEPYETVRLQADPDAAPVGLDLTFHARTRACGLRRGTMKAGHEIIWDQSHMIQSGSYSGSYTHQGQTYRVDDWWGQRDHSWGIRDHARCPLWMWLAIQLPDGMLGVWHWEYPNGARVYTDGCFAPADGSEPIPVVDFRHHGLHWTDADGKRVDYGRDGSDVRGLAGHVELVLMGGQRIRVDGEGRWCVPYGPLGGGQHLMQVRTDDGRSGTAVYEITGAHHHQYFPVPRAERLPPG